MNELVNRLQQQLTLDQVFSSLVLLFLFALLMGILWRAQKREDFDVAGFLRDDGGKESATRAWAFVALAITSWVMVVMALKGSLTPDYFLYYNLTWANSIVLKTLAERWNGTMPFGGKRE